MTTEPSPPPSPKPTPVEPEVPAAAADPWAEVAAAMKKAGLVWLSWDGRRLVPAWFVTVDGEYVVLAERAAGDEQPLPGLAGAGTAEVVVPAKPALTRLLRWTATVRALEPGSERWTQAAHALRSARLNAAGLDEQLDRWRTGADLLVLDPTAISAEPGDDELSAVPPAGSPATTRTRRPLTLHRRSRRHPRLS